MKKSSRFAISALAAVLALGLGACSSSSDSTTSTDTADTTTQTDTTGTTDKTSTDTVVEVTGTFDTVPEDYPFIPAEDFQAAWEVFYPKSNESDATTMTYDDIAEIFGAPGAYYVEQDYNDGQYKYYKWFSDDDKDILITFKGDGMTYFAWTSSTLSTPK